MTPRDLPPPVPVTTLRVYEPLEAFPTAQRPALAALAADPDAARGAERAERLATWRCVLMLGPDGHVERDGHAERDGQAVRDGRGDVSGRADSAGLGVRTGGLIRARVLRAEGATLISPIDLDESAAAGQEARGRHGLVRAWDLPVAWLAIVRAEDLTRSGGAGRYVLPMARARSRAARTLGTLRAGLGEIDVTLDVEALARWLDQFHPRSWVELDTRPVATLVGGEDGADDVRLGLECLTVGDAAGLAAAYRRMSRRSHRLEELSVSS